MSTSYDLSRFVTAQQADGMYARARAELRNGRKVSHWMWFVFPQVAGLGRSATAQHFALASLDEASAYLDHNVLGPRLVEISEIVAQGQTTSATDLLGSIDALKLRSSMTLFAQTVAAPPIFQQVLDKYFSGEPDPATVALL